MLAERGSGAMASGAAPVKWTEYDAGVEASVRLNAWAPAVEGIIEAMNTRLADMSVAIKKAEGIEADESAAVLEKLKNATKAAEAAAGEMKKKTDEMTDEEKTTKEMKKKLEEMVEEMEKKA